jgi:hypothetical protein
LTNIPDSQIVKLLKKYPNLVKFVEKIDKLKKDPRRLDTLRIHKLKVTVVTAERHKVVREFMQPTDYVSGSSQHKVRKDVSEAEQNKVRIRRICVSAMALAFMIHLKYGRNELG